MGPQCDGTGGLIKEEETPEVSLYVCMERPCEDTTRRQPSTRQEAVSLETSPEGALDLGFWSLELRENKCLLL